MCRKPRGLNEIYEVLADDLTQPLYPPATASGSALNSIDDQFEWR